jgi:CRP/FNR family cyclic AMP-dependent transcriptional regulator
MTDVTFLRPVALLAEFDEEELAALEPHLNVSRYGPGEAVLEEGDANRALHIIGEGRLRVSRRVEEREVVLCDLVSGQTFGELSILEDGVATATVHAIPETIVYSIAQEDLAAFLRDSPATAAKFWRAMAVDLRRRLVQTNDVVLSYFEVNRALVENPTFREAYAMCNR